jgi:TMEM175 potassium channel family protein
MRLNLVLLMATAFLPFPTKLLAEAIHDTDAARAASIFYGATLFVISALISVLWRVIAREPELLRPEVSDTEVKEITAAATPNLAFYVAVIVLAIFAPKGQHSATS